jgi:hypothetical protein
MKKIIFRLFFSFVVFISIFILIRRFVIPDSYGKYGHYRANSIEDNKIRTTYFKGEKKCTECHQQVYDLKASDVHNRIHCESCHSPRIAASIDCKVKPPVVKGTIQFCGQCHSINLGRLEKGAPQLNFKEHYDKQNCIECHNPHAPWEMKKK